MKKIILLCLISFFSFQSVQATHLMGGDIWVEKDAFGHYFLMHQNFRDTLGIPAYGATAYVAYKWDNTTSAWVQVGTGTLPMDSATSGGLMLGMPYGVEEYNYESNALEIDSLFAQNGNGLYRFAVTSCCRNAAILNLTAPGGDQLVISCEYEYDNSPTYVNESARFIAVPVIFGPVNQPWTYNPLPFDPDADSLAWSPNTPYEGISAAGYINCAGYTTPSAAMAGPFTLNPVSGELTWTPDVIGNHVASFKIDEYRNGNLIGTSLRDMQYIVIDDSCSANTQCVIPEFTENNNSPYNTESNLNYKYVYYQPGTPMHFMVNAYDNNPNDILTMTAFSGLFQLNTNAAFHFNQSGNGNEVIGHLNWTPDPSETRDHIVVVRANDGMYSTDFTVILKKGQAPQSIPDAVENANAFTVFPNPGAAGQSLNVRIESNEILNNSVIHIYDIAGKVIHTQDLDKVNIGENVIELNTNLSSGYYVAEMSSDNIRFTSKFVVK